MKASTWPDEIRRSNSPYDHPKWHYVDYPLKPKDFPFEPAPDPDNILFGIEECEKKLSDPKTSSQDKAAYLSWLIHLVGDVHMPLHCSSLFTEAYPTGDKGGNLFFVMPVSRPTPLHTIWDSLLGNSKRAQTHLNYAIQIQKQYPKPESTTPKEWSLESREVAIEKGYLRGELKGGTSKEMAIKLPDGYTKAAKTVAEKQAALAGYRLADEIGKWVR